jgi:hypothetical protein
MGKIAKICALGVVCGTVAMGASINQSAAGVMSIPSKEALSQSSPIESVHYRRWRHHHYYHHANWRHRHHWRHAHWRHRHYRHYGYYPWHNPAGALAGAVVGLATAPFWALGGYYGYPYY